MLELFFWWSWQIHSFIIYSLLINLLFQSSLLAVRRMHFVVNIDSFHHITVMPGLTKFCGWQGKIGGFWQVGETGCQITLYWIITNGKLFTLHDEGSEEKQEYCSGIGSINNISKLVSTYHNHQSVRFEGRNSTFKQVWEDSQVEVFWSNDEHSLSR